MATKKPKTTKAKATKSTQESKLKTAVKSNSGTKTKKVEKNQTGLKTFFNKKYEGNESILVIFKKPKLYGALLGEVFGTMCLTLLLFSLSLMGIANVALYAVGIIAILMAVFALSGANLNPFITVGMMATRRMSVIRGVLYIIAQILGAWLGWLIFNAFHLAGGDTTAYAVPTLATIAEGKWWLVTSIELLGTTIVGFFFARALTYKADTFKFAVVATGGLLLAIIVGFIVSYVFVGLSNNFIFNPAVALMSQIFPTSGANFGEIFGGICSALGTYVFMPMVGGIIGFYVADFADKLAE